MAHHHHHDTGGKNLGITILLNIGITVAQVIGGIISGSMALLSDAAHNFSDVLALIISWIAKRLTGKEQTLSRTFGYKRAEIFAAFINSSTLIIIAVILATEAVERLVNPQPVTAGIVIWLAGLSIILNGLSVLLIKKGSKESINIKSAYLHLFTDMLTSVAVLMGGFAMKYLNWYRLDGILSIAIAAYLIYSSWEIFADTLKIMMQFTPKSVNLEKIAVQIQNVEGIKNIHHIHAWQLDEHEIIFEAHVDLEKNIKISEFEIVLREIENVLNSHNIRHLNIQPEFEVEDNKELINNHKGK
jgi:cobalt-zinc-cadmium efflux system protein